MYRTPKFSSNRISIQAHATYEAQHQFPAFEQHPKTTAKRPYSGEQGALRKTTAVYHRHPFPTHASTTGAGLSPPVDVSDVGGLQTASLANTVAQAMLQALPMPCWTRLRLMTMSYCSKTFRMVLSRLTRPFTDHAL